MADQGRRFFFRDLMREGAKTLNAFREGCEEARRKQESDEFFGSYENSYSLTLAYPDEFIIDAAKQAGIEVEGRGKLEIAKELFEKQSGF